MSFPSQEVRPQKMADIVAGRIRQMIARGELKEGDWLPTEPDLIARFGVSRPTLREAFRLLESESLIRIRRGPPGGARVQVPGPEAAAPLFGLLLTLQGTTLADVYEAQMAIEPAAARKLAESGSKAAHRELLTQLDHLRVVLEESSGTFGVEGVVFHRLLVELSGNRTLSTVMGMLGEIMSRHIATVYIETKASDEDRRRYQERAMRAYEKVVEHITARDGDGAEAFWRKHMELARPHILLDAQRQVIDILG